MINIDKVSTHMFSDVPFPPPQTPGVPSFLPEKSPKCLPEMLIEIQRGVQNDLQPASGCFLEKTLTPPKFSIDTQNDGLEDVSPFNYGYFWYLC